MADYQPTSGNSISLPCIVCGEPFSFAIKPKGRYPRFCSELCRKGRGRRQIEPKACETCGETFLPPRLAKGNTANGRYCSMPCRPQSHPIEATDLEAHDRGHNQRHRARLRCAVVDQVDDRDIFSRDGWRCGICGEPVDAAVRWPDVNTVCLSHIVPLSKGGQHVAANLQCAHWLCSSRRGDRMDADASRIKERDGTTQ